MGAPTKLTPDTQKTIVAALQLGSTYVLAAQAAGVAYNTFNEWMKEGEASSRGAKREFYEAVKKAEGERAARWLQSIEQAAKDGQWQAAAWKLERIYPDDYGRNRIEITGKNGGPIDVRSLSDAELEAITSGQGSG